MKSLLNGNFQNFPMLIQIIRQNLQNPQNSEYMEHILLKGFPELLDQILDGILPIKVDNSTLQNPEMINKIIDSIGQKSQNKTEIIQPELHFFNNTKMRIVFLDILMSLVLVKKKLSWEMFFSKDQETQHFRLFKKLIIYQVLVRECGEKHMIDQIILLLLFESLPESILTNKTVSFNRKCN